MEERYTKLFTIPENLYSYGSPVIVSAGALLKDNKKGDVLVQLKIRNIQRKNVKALTVRIASFDTAGRQLGEETSFQYLDLNVKRDEEFGQKIPIILPDSSTRSFTVCVAEVVFDDQTIWTVGNHQWEPVSKRIPLDKTIPEHQLKSQFQIKYGSQCMYSFQEYQDLWYCSCGKLNRKEEAVCYSCGLQAATLAAVDWNELKAELEERLAEEDKLRAEREARDKKRREEEEIRRAAERAEYEQRVAEERAAREKRVKKTKRILAISAISSSFIVVMIVMAVLISNHIKAAQEEAARLAAYNEAVTLLDKGNYAEAIVMFAELGDYRDSAAKIEQAEAEQEEATKQKRVAAYKAGRNISACCHTVGVNADGTVVAVGKNWAGRCDVSSWSDIEAVAAGDSHTVGLRADGTVVAVGGNEYGQCDVSSWSDIEAVAAGDFHTVGLRADGTVVGKGLCFWQGWHVWYQCDVSGWSDIEAVAAGHNHAVGLRADGTVVAGGFNKYGQCDVSGWSDIEAIAAGASHTVGIRADGTVVAVGDNGSGQCDVSGWSDIVAVSAGGSHTVGLCADGTVVAVGDNGSGQCDVSDWSDIVAVAAGASHTVGLCADGTVVAVGYNEDGQCEVTGWKDIKLSE